jgi:hypothetical protein
VAAAIEECNKRNAEHPEFVTPVLLVERDVFLNDFYLAGIAFALTALGFGNRG